MPVNPDRRAREFGATVWEIKPLPREARAGRGGHDLGSIHRGTRDASARNTPNAVTEFVSASLDEFIAFGRVDSFHRDSSRVRSTRLRSTNAPI